MNERDIFIEALDKSSPEERCSWLDRACGNNPKLRSRVELLLRAHEDADSMLDHPVLGDGNAETISGPTDRVPPQPPEADLDQDEIALDFLEPSEQPDHIGRLGQFQVREAIGHGGMGVVLKANDPKLNRIVAIKVLASHFAANATARKRFLREARAAAAVTHPHVIAIYAVDEDNTPPYLVMECVDGQSLQQKIDREGELELKEMLRIGSQIAAGLAAAHAHGLIHRDIKPANILLENGVERVKITDFGLARAIDDLSITRTGEVTGTPQYMSPEQASGQGVDNRSDLFSLGCVLYAMCTGRSPFRADSTMAVLHRVCDDVHRPIGEINPEIPDALIAIIDRLLAKNPDERFQTAQEVADLLEQHLACLQYPTKTPPRGPMGVAEGSVVQPGPGALDSRVDKASVPRRSYSRRRPWAVAAIVLLALVGSLGITEATGVTHLAATVIRIATGEGTLVIEVDDPTVKVSIDGEDVSIRGAGVEELRLRPGEYQFRATKDGEPIKTELVTISRGGREVVRVTMELPVSPDNEFTILPNGWVIHEPENLGPTVNSSLFDGQPTLSTDGLTLLFVSLRPGGHGDEDLWMCTRASVRESFGEPVNLGPTVNSRYNECFPFLSADGLTLLLSSRRPGGRRWGRSDLWMCTRASARESFGEPVNLGPTVNSSFTDGGGVLSVDGLVLLFKSDRPGGQGDHDLWMCMRASAGEPFGKPVNLGPSVNSSVLEGSPALSADGRTLVFGSDRPGGQGGKDLWMARIEHREIPSTEKVSGTAATPWQLPPDAPRPAIAPFDADKAKEHQEEWAEHLSIPVEYTNSIGMKFRLIPPGEFLMGSLEAERQLALEAARAGKDQWAVERIWYDGPQHRVRITKPFYLGVYEVTQEEYERVTGTNPSGFSRGGKDMDKVPGMDTSRFPVEMVSWGDAVEFCRWLSATPAEKSAGRVYRLPTEAEWECACRAGTTTPFHFGNQLNGREANCNGELPYGTETKGPNLERTTTVGSYQPNALGLYDMHGNVNEWCQDWHSGAYYNYSPSEDPAGPATGSCRVRRGGGWVNDAGGCRSASRGRGAPVKRDTLRGFRVALVPVDASGR